MLLKFIVPTILIILMMIQIQCTIPEPDDITPPVVAVIYPYTGSILSGNVDVLVESTDNEEVSKVWIYIDDVMVTAKGGRSATFNVDLSPYADDQTHMIQGAAEDKSGNRGYSAQILVTISDSPDIVPPTVTIVNPQGGQQVQDTVTVLAAADDDRIVREVAFFVNGDSVFSDNLYPYRYDWITTNLADSTSHSIVAKAFDGSGNWTLSAPVTVTVFPRGDRIAPTVVLLYPAAGSVLSGTVVVQVDAADNTAVTKIEFYVDGDSVATDTNSPWGFSWNTSSLSIGSHTLYIKAYDAAGNVGTSGNLTFTIADNPDVTAPTVALLYPSVGSELNGLVNVAVDVYDDVGVTLMEFYVDGILINTDTNFPWGFTWNTTTLATGTHTLFIKAFDAAGNIGTTGNLTFTVAGNFDITPPTLTLLYPAVGTILQGNINVAVDVTDEVGVDSVQFYINGVWDNTDTNEPWGFLWNTTSLDSGLYTLYIKAYDPAGNVGTSGPVSFIVDN
ncbi:Ig-like domain-containing protein [Calditrichota bacterium]